MEGGAGDRTVAVRRECKESMMMDVLDEEVCLRPKFGLALCHSKKEKSRCRGCSINKAASWRGKAELKKSDVLRHVMGHEVIMVIMSVFLNTLCR